jgi:hypothetical protein
LEGALCAELRNQDVGHEHRSLHFRIRDESGAVTRYDPPIVVRRGSIVFLLEPLSLDMQVDEKAALLARFLEQHSAELVLVAVAEAGVRPRLPAEAYDEVYDAADLPRVVRRIREQDPGGIVEPFTKDRGP